MERDAVLIDILEKAKLFEQEPFVRRRLIEADTFDVDIYIYDSPREGRLHMYERDEFF